MALFSSLASLSPAVRGATRSERAVSAPVRQPPCRGLKQPSARRDAPSPRAAAAAALENPGRPRRARSRSPAAAADDVLVVRGDESYTACGLFDAVDGRRPRVSHAQHEHIELEFVELPKRDGEVEMSDMSGAAWMQPPSQLPYATATEGGRLKAKVNISA